MHDRGTPDVLRNLVSLFDFEHAAQQHMSTTAWEYFNSGAADEISLRWNREAYDRIRLNPKVLVDVSSIDTRVDLIDQTLAFPIILAPAANQRTLHADGEIATARGAAASNAIFTVSSFANTAIEEIVNVATAPVWFQANIHRDRGLTLDIVHRAQAAGCAALCVTVDSPSFGARNRQQRSSYPPDPQFEWPHLPAGAKAADAAHEDTWVDPSVTWRDLAWLRSHCAIPLLVKGIVNPDDAQRALGEGVAGIIVSNHGARNLDTLPATADALPAVADRVAGRVPVLVDGGIRRGTDIVKALALGARAVLIGRPYLYGLAVAGTEGVSRVLSILYGELAMAMRLLGRPSIASIDRSVLWHYQ